MIHPHSKINLFVFNNSPTSINAVRLLLSRNDIPFNEFETLSELKSLIQNKNNYFIIVCDMVEIIKYIQAVKSDICKNIFIVSNINLCNSFATNELDKLEAEILSLVDCNKINVSLPPLTLTNKLIRQELENLNISKKYTGFKYLVELVNVAITKNMSDAYTVENFEYIASTNNSQASNIERDIRHVISVNWKNYDSNASNILQVTLLPYINGATNTKNILNALILHVKNIIFT